MADITPKLVKELRDKTGAGMGDCKKALVETGGDSEAAIEYLRKKGAASAAKRADRAANEGIIYAATTDDGKKGALLEINCETDFVAKNAEFIDYVQKVGDAYLNNDVENQDDLLASDAGGLKVQDLHNDILAKFSEKIEIQRFAKVVTDGFVTTYVHAGSKLAVLLEVSCSNPSDDAVSMIRDIAMQIAAMNPDYIDRNQVSKERIEKEKEIFREAAVAEGKKEEIADRIATGKLEKFYQENCLVEQVFVKDSKKNIGDVLKDISKEAGEDVTVKSFLRFFLGENAE